MIVAGGEAHQFEPRWRQHRRIREDRTHRADSRRLDTAVIGPFDHQTDAATTRPGNDHPGADHDFVVRFGRDRIIEQRCTHVRDRHVERNACEATCVGVRHL